MGYMRHHAIIVTSWHPRLIAEAHDKAKAIPLTVTEIVQSPVNGIVSFMVVPDGSKEGWADSDKGDQNRASFVVWLDAQRYEDNSTSIRWVEVQYGDDEYETKIVSDSDARIREGVV